MHLSIEELKTILRQHKEELLKVKNDLKKMNDDTSNFCTWCEIMLGKTKMTCRNRMTFLVEKHRMDEVNAKETLVNQNSKCKKKK